MQNVVAIIQGLSEREKSRLRISCLWYQYNLPRFSKSDTEYFRRKIVAAIGTEVFSVTDLLGVLG